MSVMCLGGCWVGGARCACWSQPRCNASSLKRQRRCGESTRHKNTPECHKTADELLLLAASSPRRRIVLNHQHSLLARYASRVLALHTPPLPSRRRRYKLPLHPWRARRPRYRPPPTNFLPPSKTRFAADILLSLRSGILSLGQEKHESF